MREWRYEFQAVKGAKGLTFPNRKFFDRCVSTLKDGERITVTLAKDGDRRTNAQNRGLFGPVYDEILDQLAEELGIDRRERSAKEHLHEGLLQAFSGTVVDPVTKREVAKERSSTMSVQRFGEFLEFIARFMAEEYGVVIALPGEQ